MEFTFNLKFKLFHYYASMTNKQAKKREEQAIWIEIDF